MNKAKVGRLFGKMVFVLLVGFTLYGLLRNYIVRNYSASDSVCALVISKYSSSKDFGVTIEYKVNNEIIKINCTTDDCKRLKIGRKFNLEYYVDDPRVVNFHFNDQSKCK